MKWDFMHFKQSKLNIEIKKRIDEKRKEKRKKQKIPLFKENIRS